MKKVVIVNRQEEDLAKIYSGCSVKSEFKKIEMIDIDKYEENANGIEKNQEDDESEDNSNKTDEQKSEEDNREDFGRTVHCESEGVLKEEEKFRARELPGFHSQDCTRECCDRLRD